jgi:ABC-type phosphate transport system substrate-binding protein
VGLSDNAAPLAQRWANAYASETERAHVNFVEGNNGALFDDLDDEELDAILVHHIPEGRGDYWFNPVALDGLVIVVHPDNPVASLAPEQVQRLFSGETGNWSAAGGPDLAVVPYGQEHGDGARTVFTRRVMGARPVSINTVIFSSSASLLEAIAGEPGAIGYTTLSALDGTAKAVAIEGIAPAPETTETQEYPLTVPLYFVAKGEPQGELRALLAWLQSANGQSIVSEKVGSVR